MRSMRKWIFVLVLVLVLGFQINYIGAEENASLTGKATSSGASLTIVVNAAPSLELLRPVNGTYLTDENLELNYTALSADLVWYSFDNVENKTLTGNILFNTTEDEHILRIYANNSHGLSSKTVTFNVNTTRLEIDYDEFRGSGSEGSTDLLKYSLGELEDFSGLTFKKGNYGKIYFSDKINVSDDEDSSDNFVNISKKVIISQNHIEINTTALPNFNKSATLSLYGLTFPNPRILMNGEICPSSICTKVSYSSGTLVFEVTHFTIYSAEETPIGETPSGGRGGSGGIFGQEEFGLSPEEIIIKLKQGETKEVVLSIENTYSRALTFNLESTGFYDFIGVEESSFTLNPGEIRSVNIDFLAKETAIPGFYIGKIIVTGGNLKKEVLTLVSIESKESLFDVAVNIPQQYKKVFPGGDFLVEVTLYNLGETGRVDAFLDYEIKDEKGNTISSSSESIAVETRASLIKNIHIPENTKPGRYALYVGVTYDEKTAGSMASFEVVPEGVLLWEKIYISLIILLITIVAIVGYLFIRRNESRDRIGMEDIIKKMEEKEK